VHKTVLLITHPELDVNFWAKNRPDVEAARPSHCGGCGRAARRATGRLRLWGHGTRTRTQWGPAQPGRPPGLLELVVRRYRCTDCGVTRTVVPRGVVKAYRYTLAAIALALTYWAVWRWPQDRARERVSPWPVVGSAEPHRWRSLRRWASRARELFGLDDIALHGSARLIARRVTKLLAGRGPPDGTELDRVFAGAHVRGRTSST